MSFFKNLFSNGFSNVIEKVGDTADKLFTSKEELESFKIELKKLENEAQAKAIDHSLQVEKMIHEAEMEAKDMQKTVITEELKQDDKFTKRARPSVIYFGLVAVALNHIILPYIAFFTEKTIPEINLPGEFWWAWGAVVGVYAGGRTMEKMKQTPKALKKAKDTAKQLIKWK